MGPAGGEACVRDVSLAAVINVAPRPASKSPYRVAANEHPAVLRVRPLHGMGLSFAITLRPFHRMGAREGSGMGEMLTVVRQRRHKCRLSSTLLLISCGVDFSSVLPTHPSPFLSLPSRAVDVSCPPQLDDMRADSPHPIILAPQSTGFNSHLTKVHYNSMRGAPAFRVSFFCDETVDAHLSLDERQTEKEEDKTREKTPHHKLEGCS